MNRNTAVLNIVKGDDMATTKAFQSILSVDNLGITYPGGIEALRSTSISFQRGEFNVLLGLSGAGKSSLLRALNHLVKPTSGKVTSAEFGVLNNQRTLRRHRRKTAMVFQHHQLILRHTALQNVLMGRLGYHSFWRSLLPMPRADLELALHCLDRVGLADKALSRIDQLSGGQQQRVGIARALAQQPDIILADEPVASLDPATSEKVLTLLKKICAEDGITAVVSLHQLEYARHFADRIIGLANAEVVFDASPTQLDDTQLALIYKQAPTDLKKTSKTKPAEDSATNRLPSKTATQLEIA
uniref:Phosphonate ABC transporter ATP-binding protein n=2 Tax=Methylophaga nitratireducenticrescens TaxID=754476 RepID=I1XM74_METNJ